MVVLRDEDFFGGGVKGSLWWCGGYDVVRKKNEVSNTFAFPNVLNITSQYQNRLFFKKKKYYLHPLFASKLILIINDRARMMEGRRNRNIECPIFFII